MRQWEVIGDFKTAAFLMRLWASKSFLAIFAYVIAARPVRPAQGWSRLLGELKRGLEDIWQLADLNFWAASSKLLTAGAKHVAQGFHVTSGLLHVQHISCFRWYSVSQHLRVPPYLPADFALCTWHISPYNFSLCNASICRELSAGSIGSFKKVSKSAKLL